MAGYVLLDDEPKKQGYVLLDDEPKKEESLLGSIVKGAGNLAAGAVRGAGSIGATILAPADILNAAIEGKGLTLENNRQRRADIDYGLREFGANPESTEYQVGKLGTEIAGTSGAPAAIGKVFGAAPKLASAISSGGFSLGTPAATTLAGKAGDMAVRTLGGAVAGGASAGLVDPSMTETGAAIGAVIPGGVKAAGALGRIPGSLAKKSLGVATGVGDETINTALAAGRSGNRAFLDNMRGNVPITDVLDDAKSALAKMRESRAAEYRQGMAGVSSDKTVLDFAPIMNALQNLKAIGSYKGQVINKNAAGTVDDIANQVSDWAALNPAEFHTPEGLDALKRAIGDIRDSTQFGTPARKAADQIYNAVKNEITAQAPDYAKTMKAYSEASDLISEVERALSLGNKASADTAMRKLQSLMRNNVQTNYGNRIGLAQKLEEQGAEILPAIAGQAMNSVTPRGLARIGSVGAGLGAFSNPLLAAALPLSSPRLMGEALYGMGRVAGGTGNAMQGALNSTQAQKLAQLLGSKEPYMGLMTVAPSVALSAP